MGRLSDHLDGAAPRDIWVIGDARRRNPYIAHRVRVTWLRPWGGKPRGYTVEGELRATFCVRGRTLIGEVKTDTGKVVSCPWSRRWLKVEMAVPA